MLSYALLDFFVMEFAISKRVNHTASAILRQSICHVFDRICVPTPPANALVFQPELTDQIDDLDTFTIDGFRLFQE